MNTPRLETARLILRRFRMADADMEALLRILSDRAANTFLPWFPAENMEDARRFFQQRYAPVYQEQQGYCYAICLKTKDVPIGYIHVEMGESHDLGYGLRQEYWRQGIASEAARAVAERALADGVPYITATHDVNNPRSGGVMQSIGMRYQYSYEEQWQPKNIKVVFRMYQLNLADSNAPVYRGYWNQAAVRFVEDLNEITNQYAR